MNAPTGCITLNVWRDVFYLKKNDVGNSAWRLKGIFMWIAAFYEQKNMKFSKINVLGVDTF